MHSLFTLSTYNSDDGSGSSDCGPGIGSETGGGEAGGGETGGGDTGGGETGGGEAGGGEAGETGGGYASSGPTRNIGMNPIPFL